MEELERLAILHDSNVGIGKSSISEKLTVNGSQDWVKEKLDNKIYLMGEGSHEIIFSQIDNQEPEYNPADDPYYQNEDLYIPNEINCGS
jgi:hypothetical protein